MATSTKACVLFAPSEQVKLFAFNCGFIVTGLSGYWYCYYSELYIFMQNFGVALATSFPANINDNAIVEDTIWSTSMVNRFNPVLCL